MANDVQATPRGIFQPLNATFRFILDAAANADNHCVDRWFGPGSPEAADGLAVEWPTSGWIWLNPPYSRGNQRRWVEKALAEARKGAYVLALLPADTSTALFHDLLWQQRGVNVEFIRGRLKFGSNAQAAKFGSMLVKFT